MHPHQQANRLPGCLLAPRWHTALLVALIVSVASVGTLLTHMGAGAATVPASTSRILAVYVPELLVQALLAVYVCRVGRACNVLVALVGAPWNSFARALSDLALALSVMSLILAIQLASSRLLGAANTHAVAILPSTVAERLTWIAVAVTVGFVEELVYRGYLQIQLAAFTRSANLAMVVQAGLFGLAHADQGALGMIRIGIYGLVLGALARMRGSLLPGIAAHIGLDWLAGLGG